jgi:2-polyprenyl-6-methoxyphenol hydroxylase-like FAD-dependent oxidoreductase
MSPMGGIGINLAIQDAVAAVNILGPSLAEGQEFDHLLAGVQRRRQSSTRLIQLVQKIAQDWVLAPVLRRHRTFSRPPLPLQLLALFPALRRIPGRAIAMGVRQERIATPAAAKRDAPGWGRLPSPVLPPNRATRWGSAEAIEPA